VISVCAKTRAQFVISDVGYMSTMSSPGKEVKRDKKDSDEEKDENPTNVGPGITESYDDD